MKFRVLILILIWVTIPAIVTVTYFTRHRSVPVVEKSNEERPDQPAISGKEKELFLDYLKRRQSLSAAKSVSGTGESTYANGELVGNWSVKIPRTGWYGYRVDNSAYDSLRNIFYIVSYAGHLYRLEYEDGTKWTLLNQKIQLNPPDNASANPVFIGILLPDSTFRLIRSYDEEYRMEYSDDEGRTWLSATGARITRSWSNQAFTIPDAGQKRIILHTYDSDYHHIYFSDDFGQSYTESSFIFPISTYDIRITRPFFTGEVYMFVWSKNSKTVDIYKYNPADKEFELKTASASRLEGTNLSSVASTYLDGTYHFYLSTVNSNYTVYYSSDEGTTWTLKNAGRDRPFEVMCPDKPNILISGFEDMKITTDYGQNWTGYDHKLGWDLQHMRTYEKAGGKTITLTGLDFGCYISETPENKDSYIWCNDEARYVMQYDAASSENFNSIYLGNQDRGTTAYLDEGDIVNTIDIDGTDVLRVSFANHEISAWSWFYYGRIKHRYNFPTGKAGEASYDGLGNWWAAPIIASPDPSEDAIYAAYGSTLQKFSYNAANNSVVKTSHQFDFKQVYGQELGGFGYSELNRDLWYVALVNGTFIYSKDGGETWTKSIYIGLMPKANDQTYNYAKNQIVIKASRIDTNRVYYAGVGNFLLVSDDGGKRFSVKNRGLNIYRMRDFALSPDEKFIFAACGYGGAWVYSVEDDYWYQMSDDPIPTVDFTDVEFISNKNCVRFGTYGSGTLDFTLTRSFYPLNTPRDLRADYHSGTGVELYWTDDVSGEDGFLVEKAVDGGFVVVDTVAANSSAWQDGNIAFDQTCYYRIRAFKNDSVSYHSNLAYLTIPKKGFLYQGNWKIYDKDSEETVGEYAPAEYAIDNNPATFWHTQWQNAQPAHPHYLVIDLGQESEIAGFRYLPRQDGNTNGTIADFEFYVSNDPANWGTAVASGRFNSIMNWKEVIFNQSKNGQYVKLVALSEINGLRYTSAAEIALLYEPVVPDAPSNLRATLLNETNVQLSWTDNAINETGYIIEQYMNDSYTVVDSVSAPYTSILFRDLDPLTTYIFRVKAYNAAGESEATENVEITTQGSSWIENRESELKIWPNPVSDFLNIEWPAMSSNVTLKVINLRGETVILKDIEQGSTAIQLSVADIPEGIYIIKVASGNIQLVSMISKW